MNFSTRLEELRDENNLNKKEFAIILKVSDSIYSRWENENDSIPTRRLYQIANYYKVNIDYILKLTNKRNNIKSNDTIDLELISNRLRQIREDFNETLRTFAIIPSIAISGIDAPRSHLETV